MLNQYNSYYKSHWKSNGFQLSDLDEIRSKDKTVFVEKTDVWPEPDYKGLYDDGAYREDLYFLYLLYSSLGNPKIPISRAEPRKLADTYASFLISLRDIIMGQVRYHTLLFGKSVINILKTQGILTQRIKNTPTWEFNKINKNLIETQLGVNSFREFINLCLNPSAWYPHGYSTDNIRTVIAEAQTDLSVCKNLLSSAAETSIACNKFYTGCYANNFPLLIDRETTSPVASVFTDIITYFDKQMVVAVNPVTKHRHALEVPENVQVADYVVENCYLDLKTLLEANQANISHNSTVKTSANTATIPQASEKFPISPVFSLPASEQVVRKAPNMRKQQNVTTDVLGFRDKGLCFGFAGVGLDSNLTEEQCQEALNCTVVSLTDMAYLLDLPPLALSLGYKNNRMSIRFVGDTRKIGYNEKTNAIQLPAFAVTNVLAYVWGTALYCTLKNSEDKSELCTYISVMKELKNTKFYQRLCNIGVEEPEKEVFARCFVCYVDKQNRVVDLTSEYLLKLPKDIKSIFVVDKVFSEYPLSEELTITDVHIARAMSIVRQKYGEGKGFPANVNRLYTNKPPVFETFFKPKYLRDLETAQAVGSVAEDMLTAAETFDKYRTQHNRFGDSTHKASEIMWGAAETLNSESVLHSLLGNPKDLVSAGDKITILNSAASDKTSTDKNALDRAPTDKSIADKAPTDAKPKTFIECEVVSVNPNTHKVRLISKGDEESVVMDVYDVAKLINTGLIKIISGISLLPAYVRRQIWEK